MPVDTQLGHHLGPALGDRQLHRGTLEDTGLDHLQHILDSQGGIDPLDDYRRQLAVGELLIYTAQRLPHSAACRQGQATPRQLLEAAVMSVALLGNQHQWYFTANRRTGADIVPGPNIEQLAGRDQIALAALQGAKQLILGLGNDLQRKVATVTRIAIEVLLESAQTVVLDTDALALDRARTVAALIDQYTQLAAATNRR